MTQQATNQTHETIRLSVDGDQHCALLGEDLAIGVAGFGRTMAEALRDLAGALDPLAEQAAALIDGSCCVACGRPAHLSQSRVNDVAVVDVQPGCKCGAPLRVWSSEHVAEQLEEEAKQVASVAPNELTWEPLRTLDGGDWRCDYTTGLLRIGRIEATFDQWESALRRLRADGAAASVAAPSEPTPDDQVVEALFAAASVLRQVANGVSHAPEDLLEHAEALEAAAIPKLEVHHG